MKKYKVELVNFGTDAEPMYSDAVDLVNIEDDTDRIWGAEDEFTIGEILSEDEIYTEMHSYVDDESAGSAPFAFRKKN